MSKIMNLNYKKYGAEALNDYALLYPLDKSNGNSQMHRLPINCLYPIRNPDY